MSTLNAAPCLERPAVRFLGSPFSAIAAGERTGIATVFPLQRTIVTLPGIHISQRFAWIEETEKVRKAAGATLGEKEKEQLFSQAVDLIVQWPDILIRPDPTAMALALQADELLQEVLPKSRVRFLLATDPLVRRALKRRGECWRVVPPARSDEDMRRLVQQCRVAIHGQPIYYYNRATGTRFLTLQALRDLALLENEALRAHMDEIARYLQQSNARGHAQIALFPTCSKDLVAAFVAPPWQSLDAAGLRSAHEQLVGLLAGVTPPALQTGDPAKREWFQAMHAAITEEPLHPMMPEEIVLGLASEFHRHVDWLAGVRIDGDELVFDPALNIGPSATAASLPPESELVRGFILNYVREYGDLEYINIGRVIEPLGRRPSDGGRRGVYIVELKRRSSSQEIVQLLRMQKWGVREHLDEGRDLLASVTLSEEYTDFVLDRWLACRQLGMHLHSQITQHRVAETYRGSQRKFFGQRIWSAYYARDYVPGTVSCRVSRERLQDPDYARQLARLLGGAAATNLIVGRADHQGRVLFDDGDEVVEENADGMPARILVADPTGSFRNYQGDLLTLVKEYAAPVVKRRADLADPKTFLDEYAGGFLQRFEEIRERYAQRPKAFDDLFCHRQTAAQGNLRDRWEHVLRRLAKANVAALVETLSATTKEQLASS